MTRVYFFLRCFLPFLTCNNADKTERSDMSSTKKSPEETIIGRETEIEQIQASIINDRHVLLVGPEDIGKSTLIKQFAEDHPKTIYIERFMPVKPSLMGILEIQHKLTDLKIPELNAEYLSWEDLRKRLDRLNITNLKEIALTNLKEKNYLLLLDHLEEVSLTKASIIEEFMEVATMVGATSKKKWTLRRLWGRFSEEVELPPLKKEDARTLLWQTIDPDTVVDPEFLERRVLHLANNSPGAIVAMVRDLHGEEISLEHTRELKPPQGISTYLDLTPTILFLSVAAFCIRLFGLGKNNIELYLLGGMSYAIFSIVRFFAFRGMRHE